MQLLRWASLLFVYIVAFPLHLMDNECRNEVMAGC